MVDPVTLSDDEPSPGYAPADEARWIPEPPKRSGRTAFARDRARVLHSAALRRLAAKTQIHVAGEEDFPRTRLTHSLECAQVGRELGWALGCDPDLVEVACLSHDLGHPPFGHNGEDALNALASGIGGFEGNAQSLRILTRLEPKTFADGRSIGLNLTRAALDAASKYPWPRRPGTRKFGVYEADLAVFTWLREGAPEGQTCFEAQVMDWADDVSYSVHDLEDAVHGHHLDLRSFTSPEERRAVAEVAAAHYAPGSQAADVEAAIERMVSQPWWLKEYGGTLREQAALKNMNSALIGRFCRAAQSATRARYGPGRLTRFNANLVVPDNERLEVAALKAVARHFVIGREGSDAVYGRQREIIEELVNALRLSAPAALDPIFRDAWDEAVSDGERLRVVIDQVASLTDVSAMVWHRRHVRR